MRFYAGRAGRGDARGGVLRAREPEWIRRFQRRRFPGPRRCSGQEHRGREVRGRCGSGPGGAISRADWRNRANSEHRRDSSVRASERQPEASNPFSRRVVRGRSSFRGWNRRGASERVERRRKDPARLKLCGVKSVGAWGKTRIEARERGSKEGIASDPFLAFLIGGFFLRLE